MEGPHKNRHGKLVALHEDPYVYRLDDTDPIHEKVGVQLLQREL